MLKICADNRQNKVEKEQKKIVWQIFQQMFIFGIFFLLSTERRCTAQSHLTLAPISSFPPLRWTKDGSTVCSMCISNAFYLAPCAESVLYRCHCCCCCCFFWSCLPIWYGVSIHIFSTPEDYFYHLIFVTFHIPSYCGCIRFSNMQSFSHLPHFRLSQHSKCALRTHKQTKAQLSIVAITL